MKTKAISLLFALSLTALSCRCTPDSGSVSYDNRIFVDATVRGAPVPGICSNVNAWNMGVLYHHPAKNPEAEVFRFVRYVQFMQCSGGNDYRDLFKDPYDRSVLDDYDFGNLIANCRGVLAMGAKPHLKLGSVPLKFTTDPLIGTFGTNIYPPDDYGQYYIYIRDLVTELVKEFGLDEVRSWRFGCMTEYENYEWFQARSGKAGDSCEAYCKLYDYTVQALTDVLGLDVFVGAHSMTCSKGGWDEAKFIDHVANGVNYANGGKGTPLCFLSASFYDHHPGQFSKGLDLPATVSYLREAAGKAGLHDLIFGIDEGRLLNGVRRGNVGKELYNRTVGYTWQAAYDARLYKQGIDSGLDYFSMWNYLTGGNISGYPIISYHVADRISRMAGMARSDVEVHFEALDGAEVDCLAASTDGAVCLMVYNFKNDLNYRRRFNYTLSVRLPFSSRKVVLTRYLVNDDCNFFDEWMADRESLGITDSDSEWSPDDPCLDIQKTLSSPSARRKYNEVRDKYIECARLTPSTEEKSVSGGLLTLEETIEASNVMFLEIKPK